MAITVNGAVLRNMPEQIDKNVEDIEELQTASENHGTRIAALEAGAIALATFQDCTFTGTTTVNGTAFNVSAPATFTGGLTSNTVTAATVTATSLTAGSSTISGNETVSGNLAVAGTLTASGNASVGGDLDIQGDLKTDTLDTSSASEISAKKPVVEVMTGYSVYSGAGTDVNIVYRGICKNGNKLTFVIAGNIKPSTSYASGSSFQLAQINIPLNVYNKLFPIGSTSALDFKYLLLYPEGALTSSTNIISAVTKLANQRLDFSLITTGTLSSGTTYHFRQEVTFLLSDTV